MSIDLDLSHNLKAVETYIERLGEDEVGRALRLSINKSLTTVRKEAIGIFKKRLSKKEVKFYKSRIKLRKAKGNSIPNIEGQIIFDGATLSLLDFVTGKNRDIIKQKGVKQGKRKDGKRVGKDRRKVISAQVKPGKRFKIKGGFIQKVKTKQVFKSAKGGGFKKQGVSSLASIMSRKTFKGELESKALKIFNKNFTKLLQFRISVLEGKVSRAPMKKLV